MTLILAYTPPGVFTGAPTLSQALSDVRQDLFDRAQNVPAGATQRWTDDDLARALDRAVDEYSFVAPLVQSVMTATLPNTRAYAYPPGAWWIESVEYPAGFYPPIFVPFEENVTPSLGSPLVAPLVAAAGIEGPLNGRYSWQVTFFKSGGESIPGPSSAPLTLTGSTAVLTNIPLGPPGTVGRAMYRASLGKRLSTGLLVDRILDNTTTSWTDIVPDQQLGAPAPLVDSTANVQQFTLKLSPSRVPSDTSGIITVTYAAKHVLAPAGTSIPEQHHDVVMLGAAAYAMLAYQVPNNDLFEYQDGEMRDRVDERGVPGTWLAAGTRALNQFHERLEEIKSQRNAGSAAIAQWGDIPVWWQRT